MREIEDRRRRIDQIDLALARLLHRRARLAIEIRALKTQAGLPAHSPARERAIVARACRKKSGPLDRRAMARLFRLILRESRRARDGWARIRKPKERLR